MRFEVFSISDFSIRKRLHSVTFVVSLLTTPYRLKSLPFQLPAVTVLRHV